MCISIKFIHENVKNHKMEYRFEWSRPIFNAFSPFSYAHKKGVKKF